MPPTVCTLSLTLLDRIRLSEERVNEAPFPVFIETRQVRGYFPAEALRELIEQREDLSYLSKVIRNQDRKGVPGFSFVREGNTTLSDYFRQVDGERAGAAGAAAPP